MYLARHGVEIYRPRPSTIPDVNPSGWSASFDGGETWVNATVLTDLLVDGEPTWLLAHSTAASPPGDATVLPATNRVIPAVRFTDGEQVIVRDATFEEDQGQPPEIILG